MLAGIAAAPDLVIGKIPPLWGEATVEKIAVNAVMAGCRPTAMPVLVSALEAMLDPAFNLYSVQATTHPVAPLIVVNGPLARRLAINSGYNCFGQGFRANATIGRALRLVLINIGGGTPGDGDRSTQGSPSKYTYCIAENEDANPWEPLHVERGFPREVSTVTVLGCEAPHNIQEHYSNTGLGILQTIAGAMGQAGSNNILGHGFPMLSLGPEHAATIVADGYTKQSIREFIFERGAYPLEKLSPEFQDAIWERNRVTRGDPAGMARIADRPEDIGIIVAGGAGKHSCWHPTFGGMTAPVTRAIVDRNGEPPRVE
jgi:hypothetical protein